MKRGFAAAKHHFEDSLTEAYRQRDPHGWNVCQGLALMAKYLDEMDARLARIEKQIGADQPRRK